MSGATLAEKIVARAAGRARVRPGEVVNCRVDLVMMHDSGGPRRVDAKLREIGAPIFDPERVVVVSDHYVPAVDLDSAQILQFTRAWVAERGIRHFYDMRGICHVVLPEHGHLEPGLFVVGGDSHSPTGGAYGCFMLGVGATEMAGVLVTGELWLKMPETWRVRLQGRLGPRCAAKDVMLHLCRRLGMDNEGRVIEYAGAALADWPMAERMTLCNMAAELGADTAVIAPDAVLCADLERTRGTAYRLDPIWCSDADAAVAAEHVVDLDALAPQVAAPHSPANSAPAAEQRGVAIDQAYIGACTGAKLVDLKMAAEVLRGRRVASGVRLLIAPASTRTTAEAAADGTLATLTAAGAILLPSGCGACAGLGAGVLGRGEVCIASTARNFKGRMGAPDAQVYLGSPYTVAAAAVVGRIVDPRELE